MGIKGLLTPIIRDSKNAVNSNLKDLRTQDKNVVGVDISVLMIRAIKSSPNAINMYHSQPPQPIPDISDKVVKEIGVYIRHDFRIECVFDGLTPKLKTDKAHAERYGKDFEKQARLDELHKTKKDFTDADDLRDKKEEVYSLRKHLVRIRPDIVYYVKEALLHKFKDKVVCVQAPFEADHQLVSLFKQRIIDYVHTIDSDIVALGADMIIGTKSDGTCWFMPANDLIST